MTLDYKAFRPWHWKITASLGFILKELRASFFPAWTWLGFQLLNRIITDLIGDVCDPVLSSPGILNSIGIFRAPQKLIKIDVGTLDSISLFSNAVWTFYLASYLVFEHEDAELKLFPWKR